MNLNKIKNEINQMKKDIGVNEEPTVLNFLKYCERYYGRKVTWGELWFSKYNLCHNGGWVESNKPLFLKLSVDYFTKKHNVPNPVKDGKYGLKGMLRVKWRDHICSDKNLPMNKVMDNPEYNIWFEEYWNKLSENNFGLDEE